MARDLKLCRVTSTSDFALTKRIEVKTADGSVPNPALVMGAGTACPYKEGQHVVVGFIDGVKDSPVVLGPVMGWGPALGLADFTQWESNTLTVKHPTSGAQIIMDAAGNIRLIPGPGGSILYS
jgi:hypothetical protein